MSSRFVSAGTIDAATGHAVTTGGGGGDDDGGAAVAAAAVDSPPPPLPASVAKRQSEWEAVSRELEEQRRQREETARKAAEEGGEKSLFAILQENKGVCPSLSHSFLSPSILFPPSFPPLDLYTCRVRTMGLRWAPSTGFYCLGESSREGY
jgi:hypothetical protein